MQYSCRSLLLGFVALALWMAHQGERGRRHAAALQDVIASGASVEYSNAEGGSARKEQSTTMVRRAFALLLGRDTIRLRALSFDGRNVDDKSLGAVRDFPELEELVLHDTNATDRGLVVVRHAQNLRTLHLIANPHISARCLLHLEGHSAVETLSLTGASGMDHALIECLGTCKCLRSLNLTACDLSDSMGPSLAGLRGIEHLNLSFSRLSDATLYDLSALQRLASLEIAFCDVSDAGVVWLSALPNLTFVDVQNTRVTKDGVAALSQGRHIVILHSMTHPIH